VDSGCRVKGEEKEWPDMGKTGSIKNPTAASEKRVWNKQLQRTGPLAQEKGHTLS